MYDHSHMHLVGQTNDRGRKNSQMHVQTIVHAFGKRMEGSQRWFRVLWWWGWFCRSSLLPWCVVVVLVPSSFASLSPSPVRRSPFRYPSLSAAGTSLLVGGSSSVGRGGGVRWVVASL